MWALLPLKDPARAKKRLAGLLSTAERGALQAAMAQDVLRVLQHHPDLQGTLVVCDDPLICRLASACGAAHISEATLGAAGLNGAVQAGVARLAQQGVEEVLVLHGDLPLVTAEELSQLIHQHRGNQVPALTLATDRHRQGSNAVLVPTRAGMTFGYGPASRRWHEAQAAARGWPCQVLALPGLSCDIDDVDDLMTLLDRPASGAAPFTRHHLASSGIARRLLTQERA